MTKNIMLTVLIAAMMHILFSPAAASAGRVLIVSLSHAGLSQAYADENMAEWLDRGSVALMNVTTAARPTSGHLYVTLGAGSRALGRDSVKLALNQDEIYGGSTAAKLFMRHGGYVSAGQVLHLGMADIRRQNAILPYPVQPGRLGDALRDGKKIAAVIGNSDAGEISREAVAMLADGSGQVALGDVGRNILQRDDLFPFGWRIDRAKVWQAYQKVHPVADVILVDWGDFARLNEYRGLLADSVAADWRRKIFSDVSWFLSQVFTEADQGDIILLLFPVTPAEDPGGGRFGALAVLGGAFPPGAFLTSATTRRDGLISVIDVAPLILEHVGLPVPGEMLGRSITAGRPGSVSELLRTQTEAVRVHQLRPPLMRVYVLLQIIIVLGALFNVFAGILPHRLFEGPLLGLMAVPLVLLYLPLHKTALFWGFALPAAAVIITVLILQRLLGNIVHRFAVLAGVTSVSLVVDLLRNAPFNKVSVMGYDPISGARYYGVGNEYMGVLVGATVLGTAAIAAILWRNRRLLLPIFILCYAAVAMLLIMPQGGANFGGMITAAAAFPVTLTALFQLRRGRRNVLAMLSALVFFGGAVIYLNLHIPAQDQSHLGRTLVLLEQDGWQVLRDVASRKAAMNIRLFRYSQWSRVFLVFLGTLALLFFRPTGVLRDVQRHYPQLTAGFFGIIAGSIAAFLANDSGVVAAALLFLYAGVPVIVLAGNAGENIGQNLTQR